MNLNIFTSYYNTKNSYFWDNKRFSDFVIITLLKNTCILVYYRLLYNLRKEDARVYILRFWIYNYISINIIINDWNKYS